MDFRCKEGHVWKATSGNIFQGRWCPFCANHFSHTIEHAKIVAEQNKGKCLSKLYKNSRQHLNWECAKGHKWSASFDNIKGNKGKNGTWCPRCQEIELGVKLRLSIDVAHSLAKKKGGLCLSSQYKNNAKHLLWQCEKGHTWTACLGNVKGSKGKRGTWCPICRNINNGLNHRLSIDEAHVWAKKNGGQCLSQKYEAIEKKLLWRCKDGHAWYASMTSIKGHHWCPKCSLKTNGSGRRLKTLNQVKQLALQNDGECVSKSYNYTNEKLIFKCKFGHQWKVPPSIIRSGAWCPTCRRSKIDLKDFINLAHTKNGECLSDELKLSHIMKVEWQCHQGHIWKATFKQAKEEWCPDCAVLCQRVLLQRDAA